MIKLEIAKKSKWSTVVPTVLVIILAWSKSRWKVLFLLGKRLTPGVNISNLRAWLNTSLAARLIKMSPLVTCNYGESKMHYLQKSVKTSVGVTSVIC